jgi:hypothetical protein
MLHAWHRQKNASRIVDGKFEGKKPLGRSGHRWEDNIKTDLEETSCEGVTEFN